ncbi:MAG: KamA family radical SAM protein [Geobacteraceae bacterium]|nr:KamA family radical SAM protein [Geobacteraceae bacterium]
MSGWRDTLDLVSIDELAAKFSLNPDELHTISGLYPYRITRHYFNLIREKGDPIWIQSIPDLRESCDDQESDPLSENCLSPVPGLIHRYPDRVVWLVSAECAVYCRFCMRKRRVGCGEGLLVNSSEVIRYISENSSIRDVILSGGDPLMLDDEQLEGILSALKNISHVEMIRIGTRIPVTFPRRVTKKLAAMLAKYHPIYINTHFNHPTEITPESKNACAILADAGIVLGNQTVLIKNVNDEPETMNELMCKLLSIRVRPYYLHQMDLVKGTAHFRTSVNTGLDIMASLRGHLSGLAVPYYVIDLPGGKGKVPLLPGHEVRSDGTIQLTTYLGEKVIYHDI